MLQDLNLSQIMQLTGGRLLAGEGNVDISQISIDSRQLTIPHKTLFIALKGAKSDGSHYINSMADLGVPIFLVHDDYQVPQGLSSSTLVIAVSDTRKALQSLARFQREQFKKPIVAITGSNGKTIVKEWLGQVLGQQFAVAKSPKSYNSQVGVPLSIFGIEPYHQVAVLEAGISTINEMDALADMIQPDLGIFTNLGSAHEEGFGSLEIKLSEKLRLFPKAKLIIYCRDQPFTAGRIEQMFPSERLVSWSDLPGSDYTRSLRNTSTGVRMVLVKNDLTTLTFRIPFADPASLENITHVIIAALTLGQIPESIQTGIAHLKPVDMRLTLKSGINDCMLIDDTYNNDLAGLKVALDFMQQQRPKRNKVLILSDLLQQGTPDKVYDEVIRLANSHGIDRIIGVGKDIFRIQEGFNKDFQGFGSTQLALEGIDTTSFNNDLILITGARSFGFEEIVNKLQQRIHGTTLEINFNALTHNFNFYKSLLKPQTKVMVMVKAFAYGGGSIEIANHSQLMGADYLAVAFSDEGVALRKQGIHLPIMVLNPSEESFSLCAEYNLEPVVFSPEFFRSLALWCTHHKSTLSIHLDLDTGMHRLGFDTGQLDELKSLIGENPDLRVASIYTHLVGADEQVHHDFTLGQLDQFDKMSKEIAAVLPYSPLLHALNSAGIVAFPAYQFDMVRLGIGLYGVEVTGKNDTALKSISTLKTTISQVKTLAPGETVGYSRKGLMKNGGKIATLSIGYADGYDRRFSNGNGFVLIQGKKAPVIGNVCMDMCMVDVSEIDTKAGDEAIIYGKDISLKELAVRIGTIPYELLTNISTRVKRIYYLD